MNIKQYILFLFLFAFASAKIELHINYGIANLPNKTITVPFLPHTGWEAMIEATTTRPTNITFQSKMIQNHVFIYTIDTVSCENSVEQPYVLTPDVYSGNEKTILYCWELTRNLLPVNTSIDMLTLHENDSIEWTYTLIQTI